MSTAAVSSNSIYQELQAYFQQRGSDQQALGKALKSGDLAGAQQEFNAIQTLAQTGPFSSGDAYKITQRQQDFAAVGQALQAGDLQGAQQAFAQLQSTFKPQAHSDQNPAVVVNLGGPSAGSSAGSPSISPGSQIFTAPSTASANGPELVVNLGSPTAGEQITIGVSNASNGGEQVTIGVAGKNQNPEQITLNLNQNANQQIVLNLFNRTANTPPQSSVSVTA